MNLTSHPRHNEWVYSHSQDKIQYAYVHCWIQRLCKIGKGQPFQLLEHNQTDLVRNRLGYGSQCKSIRTSVIWSNRPRPRITLTNSTQTEAQACKWDQGIRDVPDIWCYLVSGQESGIHLDPVSCIRYKTKSGIILYPVESHIRYYPVHYQLLPNTAATDLYGI